VISIKRLKGEERKAFIEALRLVGWIIDPSCPEGAAEHAESFLSKQERIRLFS